MHRQEDPSTNQFGLKPIRQALPLFPQDADVRPDEFYEAQGLFRMSEIGTFDQRVTLNPIQALTFSHEGKLIMRFEHRSITNHDHMELVTLQTRFMEVASVGFQGLIEDSVAKNETHTLERSERWEENHFFQTWAIREERHQAVDAHTHTTRRWHSLFEGEQEVFVYTLRFLTS